MSSSGNNNANGYQKQNLKIDKFLNVLGFIGIVLVAIALIIGKISSGQLSSAMTIVANAIAYLVVAISALRFARSKRNVWYFVIALVAIIVVIVFMIWKD